MKRFRKPLSLMLAVLIMLSSLAVLSAVNIFAAGTLTYAFSNTKPGFAQGTISLKGESGNFDLYWADSSKALAGYRKITTISGSGSFSMPKYTAIPAGATKLIAVKENSTNLSVSSASAVFNIPSGKQTKSELLYTFGSISDPQLANDGYGSGSYPHDETHLAKALETLAKREVDFTVLSGDVVNDQNGAQTYAAEFERYQRILADSSYAAPIYEANGNHDVATYWDKNGNYYNNNAPFIKATGLDSKKETINAGKPYFEVTEPTTGDHFIFMALEGGFYTNKGTQFSKAQLDWLEGLLKKYNNDGKNIFIIEHANVGGWGSGDKLTTPYYYDLALVKSNSDVSRFVKLMETYKDCVIITGHTHLQLEAKDSWVGQYNYSDNNGTSAVMIHNSAIGGVRKLINGKIDRSAQLGLSEGYIVEVYEDYILFNGANVYYNEIIPQCSYIVPMSTSRQEIKETTAPAEPTTKATEPVTQPKPTTAPKTEPTEVPTTQPKPTTAPKTEPTEIPTTAPLKDELAPVVIAEKLEKDKLLVNAYAADGNKNVEYQFSINGTVYQPYSDKSEFTCSVPYDYNYVIKVSAKYADGTVHTGSLEFEVKNGEAILPEMPEVPTFTTEPAEDELAPVVIVEKLSDGNLQVSAYPADGDYNCQYQFSINGTVYQEYSDKATFICSAPYDYDYVISASLKYADGDVRTGKVAFKVVNGEAILPEMPEKPTKPTNPVETTGDIITVPTTNTTTTAPDYTYVYGDADLNGKINVKDATQVQKHTAKMLTLEGVAYTQADVTGDGKVNIKDATAIQKFVAKIIVAFPVEDAALVSVSAGTTAKQDLDSYYSYSSYDQYMALKKAYRKNASQSEITKCQNALYAIMGMGGNDNNNDTEPGKTVTVYFENNKNWSTVKIYAWGTGGKNAEWSGVAMTKESDGKYSYKLDYSKYQSIIFNDGNNNEQTVDISHPGTDNLVYTISGGSGNKLTVTTK